MKILDRNIPGIEPRAPGARAYQQRGDITTQAMMTTTTALLNINSTAVIVLYCIVYLFSRDSTNT